MHDRNAHPTVEVLIPIYKPGEELNHLLQKLCQQTYAPSRIHLLVTATAAGFFEGGCVVR